MLSLAGDKNRFFSPFFRRFFLKKTHLVSKSLI